MIGRLILVACFSYLSIMLSGIRLLCQILLLSFWDIPYKIILSYPWWCHWLSNLLYLCQNAAGIRILTIGHLRVEFHPCRHSSLGKFVKEINQSFVSFCLVHHSFLFCINVHSFSYFILASCQGTWGTSYLSNSF